MNCVLVQVAGYLGDILKGRDQDIGVSLVCWDNDNIFALLEGVEEGVCLVCDGVVFRSISF